MKKKNVFIGIKLNKKTIRLFQEIGFLTLSNLKKPNFPNMNKLINELLQDYFSSLYDNKEIYKRKLARELYLLEKERNEILNKLQKIKEEADLDVFNTTK